MIKQKKIKHTKSEIGVTVRKKNEHRNLRYSKEFETEDDKYRFDYLLYFYD